MTAERPEPGWRVPAPAASTRVVWPDEFGTRFTVMVDTEEEFDWSAPFARIGHTTRTTAAIPDAARRFADHGVAMAWLVDHPIVTDPASVAALRVVLEDGRSSIGTQLHPWVNPPFDEALGPRNSFVGNLPRAVEAAKLRILTDLIATTFGVAPKVYRAGRYGIGPNTLGLLTELGYAIDTSMRAHYDYLPDGGPGFTDIDNHAFKTGPGAAILELPFSTIWTGRLRGVGPTLHRIAGRVPHGRGVLARSGLVSRVALSPEDMPLADALEAVEVAVGEGQRLLNFAFHSPSLMPGHTPYVRDAADLAAFWRWWDAVLALLARRGVSFATIAEIASAANHRLA